MFRVGVLFIRVPYYIGDPKRDPDLENYPVKGIAAPITRGTVWSSGFQGLGF